MDEAPACIDRENGFAQAAWHGHKECKNQPTGVLEQSRSSR